MELSGIFVTLLVIVVLTVRRVPLSYTMLTGSLLLAVFLRKTPGQVLEAVVKTLLDRGTIELVLAVVLIGVLGKVMGELGQMARMVDSLAGLLGNPRLAIAAAPALVGLLPVFGGAYISAPMVDRLGEQLHLSPERRTAVNLVFRHALHFAWPLVPSMIITSQLAGVTVPQIVLYQLPLSLVVAVWSYIVLLHGVARPALSWKRRRTTELEPAAVKSRSPSLPLRLVSGSNEVWSKRWLAGREFLFHSSPLLLSLILALVLKVPLYLALLAGVFLALYQGRTGWKGLALAWRGVDLNLAVGVYGIMLLREIMGQPQALLHLVEKMVAAGVPLFVILLGVPGLLGLATAAQTATVGITIPLLLPIALAAGGDRLASTILIYISSYMSYYISPLHLCQALSLEYFGSRLAGLYREYILIGPVMLGTVLILYYLHQGFLF